MRATVGSTADSLDPKSHYKSSCSQLTKLLFYRFSKVFRKVTVMESIYFSTVTGLEILLKGDPVPDVFVKTFHRIYKQFS